MTATASKLLIPKGPRQEPPKRPAPERLQDFLEIDSGFDAELAFVEAKRCLYCADAPCMTLGCPLSNRIPEWIRLVSRGQFREAARVSRTTSNMPEVCGRLCPQESLCEGKCVLIDAGEKPVAIGRIEEFINRLARRMDWVPPIRPGKPTGKRVAIVGAGPAGLSAAEELVKRGHAAAIFDRLPKPGGVMMYGIPKFKYDQDRLTPLVERLERAGVEFRMGVDIGKDISVEDLRRREGFDAVLLAIGASSGKAGVYEGEDLQNVFNATDFLIRANLPREIWRDQSMPDLDVGDTCVVIGGGDTAMDCVRSAQRLGFAKTICLYRRTEAEMPGNTKDRATAKDEGVEFRFLTSPVKFVGDGTLKGIECIEMELGEPDADGRRRPVSKAGSEFTLPAQTAVLALGYDVEESGAETKWKAGPIQVSEDMTTSLPGVFAAGDAVNGADLIVTAVRDGRLAAVGIDRYLESPSPHPLSHEGRGA